MSSAHLEGSIGVNTSRFENGLKQASSKAREFAQSVKESAMEAKSELSELAGASGLGEVKEALSGTTVAAGILIGVLGEKLTETVKEAISAFGELEAAGSKIGGIIGDPKQGEEIAEWLDKISGHGGKFDELAAAFVNLKNAGLSIDDAKKRLVQFQDIAASSTKTVGELSEKFLTYKNRGDDMSIGKMLGGIPQMSTMLDGLMGPMHADTTSQKEAVESLSDSYTSLGDDAGKTLREIRDLQGDLNDVKSNAPKKGYVNDDESGHLRADKEAAQQRLQESALQKNRGRMSNQEYSDRKRVLDDSRAEFVASESEKRSSIERTSQSSQESFQKANEAHAKSIREMGERLKDLQKHYDEIIKKQGKLANEKIPQAQQKLSQDENAGLKTASAFKEYGKQFGELAAAQLLDKVFDKATAEGGFAFKANERKGTTQEGKMQDVAKTWEDLLQDMGKEISTGLKPVLDDLIKYLPTLNDNFKKLGDKIAEVLEIIEPRIGPTVSALQNSSEKNALINSQFHKINTDTPDDVKYQAYLSAGGDAKLKGIWRPIEQWGQELQDVIGDMVGGNTYRQMRGGKLSIDDPRYANTDSHNADSVQSLKSASESLSDSAEKLNKVLNPE